MVTLPQEGDWLDVGEAARELCVSKRRVQALARKGQLAAQVVLGRYVISRASVAAFKSSPRKPGRPPKPKPKRTRRTRTDAPPSTE